jgi:uncharacterized membrane protein
MGSSVRARKETIRIAGKLNELITVTDEKGNIIKRVVKPLMITFRPRDLMQVIIGASILAIPVGFTEETWNLGRSLPLANISGLLLLSLLFICSFVYYNYYRSSMKEHWIEFLKRVASTYAMSFIIVALLLTLIERAPWQDDFLLAFSRTVIVAFPASMSAAVADMIK